MCCFLLYNRQDKISIEVILMGKQSVYGQAAGCLQCKTKKQAFEFKDVSLFLPFFRGFWKQRHTCTHAGCVLFSFPRDKSNICLNAACYTSSRPGISHEHYL